MNDRDEYDWVEPSPAKTLALYAEQLDKLDLDILAARTTKSLAAEAIATERIAQIYLDCGKEPVAAVYLQAAYDLYVRAETQTKIDYLEYTYPQLVAPATPEPPNYFTDEFIATLSHEFRNPLNGILGMSEALLEEVFGTLNDRQLNAVATIERSGGYLLALINSMVALSQLQAGKLELEIASVAVAELCDFSIAFVKHHAIQKQIQLDLDLPPNAGDIAIDLPRMQQVLVDLLAGAIEATPIGGKVKLAVSWQSSPDNQRQSTIQFSVTDTSKEIPPAGNDKLSQSAPAAPTQRIGFGLMLVNPIVELHGGTLDFQSTIGRGSCVTITLPDNRSRSVPFGESIAPTPSGNLRQRTEPISSAETIAPEIVEPPLILIVEDNELNINTISSYLTAKGYRPIVAGDGRAAIELTQKFRPDAILMDIQMPGMDGLEAISYIRQNLGMVDTPIIALTALAMESDRARCLAVGANEYLTKPVSLKQLNDTIQHFLSAKFDQSSLSEDLWG